ncbi:O-methyltransferase [Caviibacter abscessus]|uniref:O-methyltransferase n=1 Tax=Caviibacter abscessus TaxID=1766719 RepID=UPI00082E47C1|nr:O-methyltransferase [Caviibacter abscessus]
MIENFEKVTAYARSLFKEDKDILEVKKYGIDNKVPIVTEEVLNFMLFLIKHNKYKTCLEIGSAIGYSGKYLAKNLHLTTIEIDEDRYNMAKKNLEGLNADIYLGDALNILPKLSKKFDFIFIDASKSHNMEFFNLSYERLNDGGMIFIDNIAFRGYICESEYNKRYKTIINKLKEFINYLNENYDFVFLPFGDGVGIVTKKGI